MHQGLDPKLDRAIAPRFLPRKLPATVKPAGQIVASQTGSGFYSGRRHRGRRGGIGIDA